MLSGTEGHSLLCAPCCWKSLPVNRARREGAHKLGEYIRISSIPSFTKMSSMSEMMLRG